MLSAYVDLTYELMAVDLVHRLVFGILLGEVLRKTDILRNFLLATGHL
jgi:hypothetical protein